MLGSMLTPFLSSGSSTAILDYLNNTAFDEMLEIDLNAGRFHFVYNIEKKYHLPITEGDYRAFYSYAVDHMVHDDQKALYREVMDPDTLARRLKQSELPGALSIQFRVRNLYGDWQWVEQYMTGGPEQGLPEGIVCCHIFDIQNVKNREAGITRVRNGRALRDSLTGLLREKDFFRAAEALLENRSVNWMMLVIDIEQFKLFNEWYGREAGDMVLARIGSGLNRDAELYDGLAGYMGNDDYCLLVPEGRLNMEETFEKIHAVITRYGVSVGFLPAFGCSFSNGGTAVMNLFDQASLATRQAKGNFKDRIRAFEPSMYSQTSEDYRVLSDFQRALKDGEITFFLQPQCRAKNGQIVGAESLARWVRPDGTMLPPATFVPILEKYGFIPDLDKFIWEEVCRWLRGCLDRKLPLIPISVNVSQVDIFTFNVPEYLDGLIERYRLPRSAVKIESTESAFGEDSGKTRQALQQLRDKGFVVLMDDFGSGYSSLNMLHELTIDIIKLDANFLNLSDLNDPKGIHILESVVNMAKTMGLPIIVEGLETESQNQYLMSLGCRYVQGFYFHKPMPAKDFEALIADPDRIDTRGILFKANEEFRIREFLNDTVYSDSMLNGILGPAAIYSREGSELNIIRFNQPFYKAVNVPDFHDKLAHIENVMPPSDVEAMHRVMDEALQDRLNGASGVFTFYRWDGGFSRFLIHFYYLSKTGNCARFYGAARDVTEISNLNRHMELISRYACHCVVFLVQRDGALSFEVPVQGMEREMQLSKEELEAELNSGAFYDHVAPEERPRLTRQCTAALHNGQNFSLAFSFINKSGERHRLFIRADYVDDDASDVKCILLIRNEEE